MAPIAIPVDIFKEFDKELAAAAKALAALGKIKPPSISAGDVAGHIDGVSQALGSLTSGFTGVATLIGGPVAGAISNLLTTIVGMPQQILAAITPFVQAFNPASIELLNLAFDNLQASLGSMLQPVIPLFIALADQLNMVFTALGPTITPAIELLTGIFQTIGNIVMQAFAGIVETAIPPLMRVFAMLTPIMELMGPYVEQLGEAASQAVAAVMPMVEAFAKIFAAVQPLYMALNSLIVAFLQIIGALAQIQLAPIILAIDILAPLLAWVANQVASVVMAVVSAMRSMVNAITAFAEIIRDPTQWVDLAGNISRRFAELQHPANRNALQGAQTVAAQQASYIGAAEIGDQVRAAAFGTASIAQQQLDAQRDGNQILGDIRDAGRRPADRPRPAPVVVEDWGE